MDRDTSKDGLRNQLEFYVLTHFKPLWDLIQSNQTLKRKVNKTLINNAIYKIPTRPYPFSTMSPYTSWDSLTDRTYSGLHLPPLDWQPLTERGYSIYKVPYNKKFPENLPAPEDLKVLFKKNGETKYSPKSTLLFPYFVQWFTDGFLRTDRQNHLKNDSHHHIDLCTVYGLNHDITEQLRSHQGGKLKSQIINDEEYPHYYYDEQGNAKTEFSAIPHISGNEIEAKSREIPLEKKTKLFAMGVALERANVQIGYVMFNILCLREHNRLCDLLAQKYPNWDDERLFQTARNIVIVTILKIVLDEYINHITPYNFKFFTDPLALVNERWYRLNWMTIEFSLVYRWHSTLPENLIYQNKQIPMSESLWNNSLITKQGLGALFAETCSQPAGKLSLFNTPDFLLDTEIASIKLGRITKLRSYNDYRQLCNFPRVTKFEQITSDVRTQEELKRLYGHVDNLEFYVGIYAEDLRPNSTLPPLVGRLVGIDAFSQALTNPLLAEKIFHPETFSPLGWEVIHNTHTLSDLVHRNIPQKDQQFRITFFRDN